MFTQKIASTSLTTDAATSFFENKIEGNAVNNDLSFIATLRALVYPRLPEDESLEFYYGEDDYSLNTLKDNNIRTCVNAVFGTGSNKICLKNFNNYNDDANIAWLEAVRNNVPDLYPGYILMEKITEFYKRSFPVVCFVNPDTHHVYIYVTRLSLENLHYLQCSIPAFLPWFFDPEKGVTEIEMELIKSLREKSPERYLSIIDEISKKYNFREMHIKRVLEGFEAGALDAEISTAMNNVDRYKRSINDLQNRINSLIKEMHGEEYRYLGILKKQQELCGESEIMQYFLCNKTLNIVSVASRSMVFEVMTYLDYFDEDLAKQVIDNQRSNLYYSSRYPYEDMKRLFEEIFIKRTMRIKIWAAYRINLGDSVDGISDHDSETCDALHLPNPHIYHYACLGDYRTVMNEMVMNNDYIGCIEQCCASAKSLNFGDGVVMEKFSRDINNRRNPFIEMPDGSVCNVKQAIDWLKQQGGNENHE